VHQSAYVSSIQLSGLCSIALCGPNLQVALVSASMSTALENSNSYNNATNGINDVKGGTKIKSKNQLRRLKAKQKKTTKSDAPVCGISAFIGKLC
jgi:hypothetical protein